MKAILTTFQESELKALLRQGIGDYFSNQSPSHKQPDSVCKQILTRKETAELLSISLPTLHTYSQRGLIKAFRLGTKVRYKLEDVYQSLQQINIGGTKC